MPFFGEAYIVRLDGRHLPAPECEMRYYCDVHWPVKNKEALTMSTLRHGGNQAARLE